MPALFADLAFALRQLVNHRVYAIGNSSHSETRRITIWMAH
jgi:hypothetical protein